MHTFKKNNTSKRRKTPCRSQDKRIFLSNLQLRGTRSGLLYQFQVTVIPVIQS